LLPKRLVVPKDVVDLVENFGKDLGIEDEPSDKPKNWFYKKVPDYLKDAYVEPDTPCYLYQFRTELLKPQGNEKDELYAFMKKKFTYGILLRMKLDIVRLL